MNNKITLVSIFSTFIALIVFAVLFVIGTTGQSEGNNNPQQQTEVKQQDETDNSITSSLPDERKIDKYIGKKYKDFHGIDENEKVVKISDLIEGKPAVVIFIAIGDKPGTFDFMPHMNKLYDKYKDKVEFITVLLSRSDKEEVQELKKITPIKMPVLRGYSDAIKNYQISKIDVPYILVIDKEGNIRHIILRPESEMINEAPYVDHSDYKNKTQIERINSSIDELERYIQEIGE